MRKFFLGCAGAVALTIGVGNASAATLSVAYSGNDCSGVFGQGFSNCNVTAPDGTKLSPVMAKYDNQANGITDVNQSVFPSLSTPVSGVMTEFSVNETTKTWTYTPGANDPLIKYWVLKQTNAFTLYWNVADASVAACSTVYSLSCMLLAQSITSGSWTGDFSHITWYDTKGPGGAVPEVPLPAGILLLISALGGLGLLARSRKVGSTL